VVDHGPRARSALPAHPALDERPAGLGRKR
jgi:hypothetical protein